jgi:hypothetical protein
MEILHFGVTHFNWPLAYGSWRLVSGLFRRFAGLGETSMKRFVDHDLIVEKNRAIAHSYESDARDKALEGKGFNLQQRQQEASCFNCKMKQKCPQFRAKRTGGTLGVVSFGGDQKFICDRYTPNPSPTQAMSNKQVKSLLKIAKRGLR